MAENRLPLGQCSFLPEIIKIKDDKFENAEIFLLQTGSAKRVHQRHHHHRYSTAAAGQNKKVHPGDKSIPFQHEAVLQYRIFLFLLNFACTVYNCPIILKSSLLDSASSQLSGEKSRTNLS